MPTDSGGTGTLSDRARAVEALLISAQRALTAWTLYSPDHPAVEGALRATAGLLGPALAGAGSLTVIASRDQLLFEGSPLGSGGGLRELAAAFRGLDTASIVLAAGLGAADLRLLVQTLASAPDSGLGAERAGAVQQRTSGRIRLVPIEYDALTLTVGAGSAARGGAVRMSWSALVKFLVVDPTVDARSLARSADAEIERRGPGAEDALWRELEAVDDLFRTMRVKDRVQALKRLNTFLDAVSPRLRGALSAASRSGRRGAVSLLLELGGLIHLSDVLDAIQSIDDHSQTPMREVLILFHALARTAEQNASVRERLGNAHEHWISQAVEARQGDPALTASLEEILHNRASDDWNPDSHRAHLERLAREGPENASPPRYPPLVQEDIEAHAAAVCGVIASDDPAAARRCPGLFALATAGMDRLLDSARVEPLVAIAHAASTCGPSDAAGPAASLLVQELSHARRLDRLIALSRAETPAGAAALSLIRLAGPAALPSMLGRARGTSDPRLGASLRAVAGLATEEQLASAVASLDPRDPGALASLLLFLPGQSPERTARALEPLLRHKDEGVRHRAYRLQARLCPAWPALAVKLGLQDPAERIHRLTIERLALTGGAEGIRTLIDLVEHPGRGRATRFDAAAGALAASVQDGPAILSQSLRRLSAGLRPRRAWYAARLARLLQPHLDVPHVARAVRRWRRSPARFLGAIMPAPSAARGGGA